MPFTKENPGKGRPPSSPNKTTKAMRDLMRKAAEDGYEKFTQELNKLSGEKYVNAYLTMCKFCIPTLQSVKVDDVTPAHRSITAKLNALAEKKK